MLRTFKRRKIFVATAVVNNNRGNIPNARISSQESKHRFLLSPALTCLVSSSLFNSLGVGKMLHSEFAQYVGLAVIPGKFKGVKVS